MLKLYINYLTILMTSNDKIQTMNMYFSSRAIIFIYKVSLSDTIQEIYDFSTTTSLVCDQYAAETLQYFWASYLSHFKTWKLESYRPNEGYNFPTYGYYKN
jgi:hypothetical protein